LSARARERVLAALASAAALALVCTVSPRAEAHRIGLSQGAYSLSGHSLDSRLTFAASELMAAFPGLDGDGDGHLSAAELTQNGAVRTKIFDRMTVSRGAVQCEGTLESVAPSADDGVVVVSRHDCEGGSGDLRADLGFLTELEKGHRHVARIAREGGDSEAVAYDGNARLSLGSVTASSTRSPALEYLKLGIEHILGGADHLLFLLGVVLLPASLRSLLLAVTAFTLSHSLTLVLSTLGLVRVSGAWVEPLIALSVAYIGVENWFSKDATRRWRLTFAFGLVHGLGFATALRDVGVPPNRLPVALACFNVGVEIGQLLVVLGLWTALRHLQQRAWFRPWVLGTTSVALALVGLAWSVERTGLFLQPVARGAAGAGAGRENGATEKVPARSSLTEPPPLVTRLCGSLSELPRVRRAECSHTKPGISLGNQCARMLATSVSSGAVSLVESEIDRCLTEWNQRYEGCGFVERASLPPPVACQHVLVGNLGAEATCRSSLECAVGLHCDGVGPMDSGRCRPPRTAGASCGLAVDPLLAYVRGAAGADRKECQGACINNRCTTGNAEIARRP
jgi:hydrogenase/urease accessory protein HupE